MADESTTADRVELMREIFEEMDRDCPPRDPNATPHSR
jgi:hypothetical protein